MRISMNQRMMRARLQILPVITTMALFLPGSGWAQPPAEPKIRIEGPCHGGTVRSVAFSPDGKLLASASEDKTIKLWQVSTGKHIRLFNGHAGSVYSVAFSPDGKTLASSSEEGNESALRLWEVNTGRLIRSFEERNQWVTSVVFSPDGRMIASGSSEHKVKLWDVKSGKVIRSHDGQSFNAVAFSPDGKTLAAGSYDRTV